MTTHKTLIHCFNREYFKISADQVDESSYLKMLTPLQLRLMQAIASDQFETIKHYIQTAPRSELELPIGITPLAFQLLAMDKLNKKNWVLQEEAQKEAKEESASWYYREKTLGELFEPEIQCVIELLRKGYNPNMVQKNHPHDDQGNSLLHLASFFMLGALVQELLEAGADLRCQNALGFTPLFMVGSSLYKDAEVVMDNERLNVNDIYRVFFKKGASPYDVIRCANVDAGGIHLREPRVDKNLIEHLSSRDVVNKAEKVKALWESMVLEEQVTAVQSSRLSNNSLSRLKEESVSSDPLTLPTLKSGMRVRSL